MQKLESEVGEKYWKPNYKIPPKKTVQTWEAHTENVGKYMYVILQRDTMQNRANVVDLEKSIKILL